MSISSVGGTPPQSPQQPSARGTQNPDKTAEKELTTVKTHCNKKHKHDRTCPHSVSTRPVPQTGEVGSLLDKKV